jgi:hypothetical protein
MKILNKNSIEELVNNFLKNYSTKKYNSEEVFEEFLKYIYFSFDSIVNNKLLVKDKYIRTRKNYLEYITNNKRKIISYICNNRIK